MMLPPWYGTNYWSTKPQIPVEMPWVWEMKGGTLLIEFVTTVVVIVVVVVSVIKVSGLVHGVGSVVVSSDGIFHITSKTM